MPDNVKLGPLSRELLLGARSAGQDQYPANQRAANELERLLSFAVAQDQLQRFRSPISKGQKHQRDEALQELRTAFFLARNGFSITQWDPPGLSGAKGEYSIKADGQEVFVEVKSPGWEAELSPEEIQAGRAKQPKYIQGDARAVAPWLQVRQCVSRAYYKFNDSQPNLLIIADDFHIPLTEDCEQVEWGLFEKSTILNGEAGYFTNSAYEHLGGIAVFSLSLTPVDVEYAFRVFTNPFSLPLTRLPNSLVSCGVSVTLPVS
jgi:hypothetical protein